MVQIESIVLSYKHIVFIYTHTHTKVSYKVVFFFFFFLMKKKGIINFLLGIEFFTPETFRYF